MLLQLSTSRKQPLIGGVAGIRSIQMILVRMRKSLVQSDQERIKSRRAPSEKTNFLCGIGSQVARYHWTFWSDSATEFHQVHTCSPNRRRSERLRTRSCSRSWMCCRSAHGWSACYRRRATARSLSTAGTLSMASGPCSAGASWLFTHGLSSRRASNASAAC